MKNLIKILCAISLLVVACKKEDTPAPVIVNGMPSINVTNGTSVQYSDWLVPGINAGTTSGGTNSESGGTATGTMGSTQYFTVKATAISQDILDKGVVMAFAKLAGDNNNIRSLPATIMISGYLSTWDFAIKLGQIQFTQFSADTKLPAISGKNQFRYVIIPPTKHLRLRKPLKDMTYDEICDMFNIPK